jgi:YihY family inner membrane protein
VTVDQPDTAARHRRLARVMDSPPVQRAKATLTIFDAAGGGLLASGLAYTALVAGLTGLLLAVGILGYLVPSEADRKPILDAFNGQFASLAPAARDGLETIARHAGAFSFLGLAGLAWAASQFYGALDQAIARVFARTPARGLFDRILRGFASVLLLIGGLASGVAIASVQAFVAGGIGPGAAGDVGRFLAAAGSIGVAAVAVIATVALIYRIVPNTAVPIAVLRLPAIVAGLAITALTRLLVYIAPLLAGGLSVFGSVAVVFVALAWLQLAFQVVLIGAAWTSVRLDARAERAAI